MALTRSDQGKNQERNQEQNGVLKGSVKNIKKSDIHLPTRENIKRNDIAPGKKQELQAMRDRLYSRAEPSVVRERQTLSPLHSSAEVSPKSVDVRNKEELHRIDEKLQRPHAEQKWPPIPEHDTIRTPAPPAATIIEETVMPQLKSQPKKITLKGYRTKIIAVAVLFFVVALVLSSGFLFFGPNTISGNNIAIEVHAPLTIGGGEELSLEVAVTNNNAVAVESATLIVEYPTGTQEASSTGKELFRDRIPLGSIKPGEVLQTPVKAKIFGEENDAKTITISVEYRTAGSNATFFTQAAPVQLKISSSPVGLSIDGVKEVSSGQELALTLNITSNSSTPLSDLLIQAEYPLGFDFSSSDQKSVKGQNVWSIHSLAPGGKATITIKGIMVGGSAEARTFHFSVGVPSDRDHFSLASVLTKASTEVTLTNPFVGLVVTTNGSSDKTISVGQNDSVGVSITFANTLQDTIYDGTIKATLSGNGLNASNVSASNGFYDSSAGAITWDKGSVSGLGMLTPGAKETVSFSIRGVNLDATKTPQVSYTVSVAGRRVSESKVPQELTNIESRIIRFESATAISAHGLYSIGPFTNTGPVPPRAEMTTQYTIMLNAKNGSNQLTDVTVMTTLPSYVSWGNAVSSGHDIAYNTSTREVTWRIGNLDANAGTDAAFQIGFLPSVSQVGTVPTLVGSQSLRATDRFTGTVVRATAPAVTTSIPEDPSAAAQGGVVQPK